MILALHSRPQLEEAETQKLSAKRQQIQALLVGEVLPPAHLAVLVQIAVYFYVSPMSLLNASNTRNAHNKFDWKDDLDSV